MSIEFAAFPQGIAVRDGVEKIIKPIDELDSGRAVSEILPIGEHEIDFIPDLDPTHRIILSVHEKGTGTLRFLPRKDRSLVVELGTQPKPRGRGVIFEISEKMQYAAIAQTESGPAKREIVYAVIRHLPGRSPQEV